MNRFKTKPDQFSDLCQWMRKNLTQAELDYLRGGACAFHPLEGLAGATKDVVLDFCAAFAGECECGDGHHMHGWKELIAHDPDEAATWSGWTCFERESALLISDVLADYADYDDVNVSACADLLEDPDVLEEYLVEWTESDDETLVNHARKLASMAGVDLDELI